MPSHPVIPKFYYLHVFSYGSFMYNNNVSPLIYILPTITYRMYSISLYCTFTIFVVIVHLLYLLQLLSFFFFSYRTCPRCSSRHVLYFLTFLNISLTCYKIIYSRCRPISKYRKLLTSFYIYSLLFLFLFPRSLVLRLLYKTGIFHYFIHLILLFTCILMSSLQLQT